nr:hypothetical protein [Tanacetum cinerariifolium]
MLNLKTKERRREKRQRIQNRKKRKKKRTWLPFFVAKGRKNTLVFIRNREEKQAIKPRFLMNPTTIMVDEGRIYAKTEDPHEDIGKLDGDKAVISRNDDQEMIKHMHQTNKSHEDLSGDGGTNPAGIWLLVYFGDVARAFPGDMSPRKLELENHREEEDQEGNNSSEITTDFSTVAAEDHISKYGFDPNYKTWIHHREPDLPPPSPVIDNTRQPHMSDITACLNDLSYIPLNNEQNEPTQGDIGETSNDPNQAKRNEFEELYASANKELYPGCDYVTRLDFMAKFTYFKVKGLAANGFNPFGNLSQSYNMWSVILTTYNLPPWLCMKESCFKLMLLIPGPKYSGKDIDVYLRPLIDDLKDLWAKPCVETIDVATGLKFNMRAMVLWTINDFPARSSLSGWSGQGYRACPTCNEDTLSVRLHLQGNTRLKKAGHSKWLVAQPKQNEKCSKPQAAYSFTPEDRKKFCQFVKGVKLPDGFGSNFKHKVTDNDTNITGLKSHDCHIMMQCLLLYGLQQYFPPNVAKPLIELCLFFKKICSQTLMVDDMLKAQSKVIDILCNLELIYHPPFFDIMIHLVIHLPLEAIFGGPIRSWWMYPFERYMKKLKKYVRNKAKPEDSIAEGYVAEEALNFSSHYFRDVTMKFNRLSRNVDFPPPTCHFKVLAKFALACGPSQTLISVNSYVVNGVRSVVHSHDERRTTQNSDICSPGPDRQLYYDGQSIDVDAPPYIIDVVDEDDDIIDEEDSIPHDLADSNDEDLVNLDIDDGVNQMLHKVTTVTVAVMVVPLHTRYPPAIHPKTQFGWQDAYPLGDPEPRVKADYLGELVRELSLHHPSWRQVPPEQKAGVVAKIGTQFDLCTHIESGHWPKIYAGIQQHLQKLYNGKNDALKEMYWVPNEDGTYDVERNRHGRPAHIFATNWDEHIAFWNDPKNLARVAQNKKPGKEHMESSTTREYPSLIHTFLTYIVGGVFLNPEDRALYDEMLRLQSLGSNTPSGVPYTDDEIMVIVRAGKQRGHFPGVGRVLPRQGMVIPPPPPSTHSSDVAKLKKSEKRLTKQVNMFMKLFKSDDKFSQMLTQLES